MRETKKGKPNKGKPKKGAPVKIKQKQKQSISINIDMSKRYAKNRGLQTPTNLQKSRQVSSNTIIYPPPSYQLESYRNREAAEFKNLIQQQNANFQDLKRNIDLQIRRQMNQPPSLLQQHENEKEEREMKQRAEEREGFSTPVASSSSFPPPVRAEPIERRTRGEYHTMDTIRKEIRNLGHSLPTGYNAARLRQYAVDLGIEILRK